MVEKLFLHVLISLTPVLVYYVLFENKMLRRSPYLIGVLHGVAAFLCMIFAYSSFGLFWDLRYVSLVLAALYGGPVSGGIVFVIIVITRTVIGGEAILFGYMSAVMASIIPLLLFRKFNKMKAKSRVGVTVIIGFWPAIVQLCIQLLYLSVVEVPDTNSLKLFMYILLFGLVQIVALGFASTLYEAIIEKQLMKEEIKRSEKLNTIGELAASIAHEVRNPLTVVKGFIQLMKENQKNTEYLSLILSELKRAEEILNEYLNFAKPQLERDERFSLTEILHEIVCLLEPFAAERGVVLVEFIEENMYIKTDRNKLKQALINFFKNAIEATNEGGKVSAILSKEQQKAKIMIKDTGRGMTEEQLSKLGTLFYTTKDKGTGLGTTVSMRIIEAMNGNVTISSKVGVGTEVILLLPSVEFKKSLH